MQILRSQLVLLGKIIQSGTVQVLRAPVCSADFRLRSLYATVIFSIGPELVKRTFADATAVRVDPQYAAGDFAAFVLDAHPGQNVIPTFESPAGDIERRRFQPPAVLLAAFAALGTSGHEGK
jgi:hypothetical protein